MQRLRLTLVIAALLMGACVGSRAFAAGTPLRIGSDISYAPLEFYTGAAKQVTGFDYDLAQALGKVLGRPIDFANHDFNSLITDVRSGRIDAAMSAISDTRAREAQVNFLDYFVAGSGMLVPRGNPHQLFNIAALCGYTVDLQRGTAQAAAVAEQSKICTAVHLGPIHVLAANTDEEALKQLLAGKSDVHLSDYPVVAYLAHTLDGGKKYVVAGRQFAAVPYGIAVRKGNIALLRTLQQALVTVIADGMYDSLLKKWHLEQGALRSAPINAGTLFQH